MEKLRRAREKLGELMDKSTLGDYTIIKQIGQGTLGSVYLAEHRFVKQQYV